MEDLHVDVVIVGACVSGVNAAHRIQTQFPHLSYTILEARGSIGCTRYLFKYPGIRPDSDLYTFGFTWRVWSSEEAIVEGRAIKKYLIESAEKFENVRSLDVEMLGAEQKTVRSGFVLYGSGYYDYDEPLKAVIPGLENFKGTTIHSQFWPEHLDYSNKKIIIIGSGATAVALLPVLAQKAESVTMLQRRPTYIISVPAKDKASWIRNLLPSFIVHRLVRWKFMWMVFLYFQFCREFPALTTKQIKEATERKLFYRALRKNNANVITDTIERVTDTVILTACGTHLDADIIITNTGLKMKIAGGAQISIDGQPTRISDRFIWKGMMVQDIPNSAFLLGYSNASGTLGARSLEI
ncbi:hypothetical protein BKA65DRAFT_560776 [Rhexocercosporidium sp. MPI-PUGE-AT-0058]|nr:hypothetical protein BKA65DRAFT_560776 [Rhexocercosporidium sp. MPI-PUGE-AT-0058]